MRLRHALAVLLGMLLGAWQSVLAPTALYQGALALALILALLSLWLRRRSARPALSVGLSLLACALLGFGYLSVVAQQRLAQRFAPLEVRGDRVAVIAKVVDLPRHGELFGRDATRLSLQLQADPRLGQARHVRAFFGCDMLRRKHQRRRN